MMKEEFEALYGAEVSHDDYYNIIEPMYLATELYKTDFVAVLDKKRFALRTKDQIIKEMKRQAQSLYESCTHFTDWDTINALYENLEELNDRFGSKKYRFRIEERMKHSCFYPAFLVQSPVIINLQGD